ncbi:MAG: hypothetical protein H0X26_07605 [Alphaproteobacteria bacterium]|nr:hypothetical protein [Alphaproteobacteria bacterium]
MGRELKLLVKEEDQIGKAFVIGHGAISCTTHPNAYHDENNKIIWWDCPGFLDNKGIIQELSNQIAVSKLFTGEKPSKILLVANHAKFEDTRGRPVWEAIGSIVNMFKNSNEDYSSEENQKILQYLKNNLLFITTHAPDNFDMKYELAKLNAAPIDLATEMTRDLMDHLFLNVSTKCFTSFKPSKEGLFELGARNDILQSLKETLGSNLVARQASVDPYSKQCAEAVTNQIRSDIELKFSEYINRFITPAITVKTLLSDLHKLQKFFEEAKVVSTAKIDDTEFLDKLVEASNLLGESSNLGMLTSTIKDTMEIQPFLIKFGSPHLNIGRSWRTSSMVPMCILEGQIKSTQVIEEINAKVKKLAEGHARDLDDYHKKHSAQLEEQSRLREEMQSKSEADQAVAKQELDALNLKITTFEVAQTKKEEEHKAAIQRLKTEEKTQRMKAKQGLKEKREEEEKRLQEKLTKQNKKIKKLQEKMSNALEDERGVFGHIGKALDIVTSKFDVSWVWKNLF